MKLRLNQKQIRLKICEQLALTYKLMVRKKKFVPKSTVAIARVRNEVFTTKKELPGP